ncbi:MAG: response regulator transcription factor [Herpetosiphon sp.]
MLYAFIIGWGEGIVGRTILVVDDEPRIVQIVRDYLERSGFNVVTSGDGSRTIQLAREARPALIVLDLMLPGMDGLDVTRIIRQDPVLAGIPIIMLTARVEESDRLVGLELGADDYLTKPFSPRELVARVRAVLRRSEGKQAAQQNVVRFGELVIDRDKRAVTLRGTPVELTATEWELLQVLISEPGRPFTRTQLLERAYDISFAGYDRTVDAHIKNLRRKIEPDPHDPQYLLTIYGVGYKFADHS